MSGTSARESYRAGKRTRPVEGQTARTSPPVLFRLPSIAMPGVDSSANASNAAVAMAMPVTTAAAVAAPPSQTSVVAAPSAPAHAAAVNATADKVAGQRLLNTLILILLLAAIAVLAWITINARSSTPTLAKNDVGNDAALETLGDLQVPGVSPATPVLTAQPKSTPDAAATVNNTELSATSSGAGSLLDVGPTKTDVAESSKAETKESDSLILGLESLESAASSSNSTNASTGANATAQIQLRTPVPMGNSNVTSLVDAQRTESTNTSSRSGSSTSAPVEMVSTPSKVFPANPDLNTATGSSSTNSSSAAKTTDSQKANSGASPSLWEGAQKPGTEGLQLSQNGSGATASSVGNNAGSVGNNAGQVNISNPLSREIAVGAASAANANQVASREPSSTSEQGVTVGAGEPVPYSLNSKLGQTRADLDILSLANVAASGAAKSAATNTNTAPRINSYVGAANPPAPGTNLYQNNYVNPAPAGSTPINSYNNLANVPRGTTGNNTGAYVPPTGSMGGVGGNVPSQMVSGPTSLPASTAGYNVPPRGANATYGSPTNGGQVNASATGVPTSGVPATGTQTIVNPYGGAQGYGAQPTQGYPTYNPNRPAANQPTMNQSIGQSIGQSYGQPVGQQPVGQPGVNPSVQPSAYPQPGIGYGSMPGSGYANPAYPSPSPTTGTNRPGYQSGASYPTTNIPFPGGQLPGGMIGGSGYATAPNGDLSRPVPVMGNVGSATSVPYGAPQ